MRGFLPVLMASVSTVAIIFTASGVQGGETERLMEAMRVTPREVPIEAPDFTLPNLDGELKSLKDYRGKVVFLNFWATWCPPCKEEIPSMNSLYNRFKDRGLEVLAISIDTKDGGAVKEFLEEYGVDFPVLLDKDQFVRTKLYQLLGLPTTFLIDRDGMIIGMALGDRDWDKEEARELFEHLLKGGSAPTSQE